MSAEPKPPHDPTMTSQVSGILGDVHDLVRQHTELLKHDVRTGVRRSKEAGLLLGAGAVLGLAGVLLLGVTLAHLLHWAAPSLPLWACHGVWAFAFLAGAAGLLYAGRLKFESVLAMPEETAQAIKDDVKWLSNGTTPGHEPRAAE